MSSSRIAEAHNISPRYLQKLFEVEGTTDFFGHSYFTSNPRASADIIALLRYGLGPDEPGRPLEHIAGAFWRVPAQ